MSEKKIDPNSFTIPIQEAVRTVIGSMGQIDLKAENVTIVPSTSLSVAKGEISGIVSVQAQQISGTLALNFESSLICKIYSNILGGEAVSEIDSDVSDAAMEITNIVFGNAKRDINKLLGIEIQPSLPNIVSGKNHKVHHPPQSSCLCLSFVSEFGRLYVECSL